MKKILVILLAAAMMVPLAACSAQQQSGNNSGQQETTAAQTETKSAQAENDRETIYQVSLLQGLTFGDYNGSVSVADLKKRGDIGIGTFEGLNGELIAIDGKVYNWQAVDKSLTPLQLCAYGPMIFDRAKRVIQVIADATPEEVEVMLEDVNWLCGPLTHFSVCSAS